MTRIIFLRIFIFIIPLLLFSGCMAHKQPPKPHYDPRLERARENAHLVFNYLHQGYTDYAFEKLQIALQLAPADPVILDTAGYFYEKTGRIKLANRYYKEATIVSPYSGIAKNNYGAFLCRNGYYRASIPYFLEAASMPRTPVTREALANAQYCRVQMKTRLGDRAT